MTALYVYNCSLQWKPSSVGTMRRGQMMSVLVVASPRAEEDGVISVPPEGSVTSSVSSVVDMVWTCVCRGSVGVSVGVTAGRLGVSTGGQLETVQLILHLPGLSRQHGHSVDGQSPTHQG